MVRALVAQAASGAALGGRARSDDLRIVPGDLGRGLDVELPGGGGARGLRLEEAMDRLAIPSVGIALIEDGGLAWARAYGASTSTRTLYQAASMSKTVAAVAALRLVQEGRLDLDADVDARLTGWRVPPSDMAREHPVTLRGLLSMTGGIGVPGFLGYAPGAALPNLEQILDGRPPAVSPPVRVESVPGSGYAYSGGGYEIVQALVEAATGRPFADAAEALVLAPAGMADSRFAQPLPAGLASRPARGHDSLGAELPGGWRVLPELAAAGLWATPTDLAKLLVALGRARRGDSTPVLDTRTVAAMLTRQNGGPYGLGAAVVGSGRDLALMKSGQNVGYQGYMLLYPEPGRGLVVMTGSDNGNRLAAALIRRTASLGWPPVPGGPLPP